MEKIDQNKLIIIVSGLIFFIVVIIDSQYDYAPSPCDVQAYYSEEEYHGTILGKYINTGNHANKTIILNGNTEIVVARSEQSGFYEFLETFDKITKRSDTSQVKIIRGTDTLFWNLDYGCTDNPGLQN